MTSVDDLRALADSRFDEAVDTRRAVHAQPELSHREAATSALVDDRLRALGLEALPCPTDTGAVYRLDGGLPGHTVLLRADIDALPLLEEVDVPWRSRVDGGAPQMVRGGVLDVPRPDRMVSLHLATLLATGLIGARPGVAMSSAQFFRIDIGGRGGHGSLAGREGNVVLAVSALSQMLPDVVEGLEFEDIACACSAGVIRA